MSSSTVPPPSAPASLAFAQKMFARGTDCFGAHELAKAFKMPVNGHLSLPPLPFTEEELSRARELDQYLVYRANMFAGGIPITLERLHDGCGNEIGDGVLISNVGACLTEDFFFETTPRAGWRLVSREIIPNSRHGNYFQQTQAIHDYLYEVYGDKDLPGEYLKAALEFNSRRGELKLLMANDLVRAARQLVGLKLNQLFRETAVEAVYDMILQYEINGVRLLGDTFASTQTCSADGKIVSLGYFDSGGTVIEGDDPNYSHGDQGVRFSRGAILQC